MTRQDDGRWQARLTPPVGSLLRYRYARQTPSASEEFDGLGRPVRERVVHVTGPTTQDDLVAAWIDAPYLGQTGRVIGRIVDAATAAPLREIVVSASGVTAYTDGEGAFRLDGLVPGLHSLVAFTTDGAYRPQQRQAIVAAESATPAELALVAAPMIDIAFEVTLPEGTPADAPIRVAGNVRSFGRRLRRAARRRQHDRGAHAGDGARRRHARPAAHAAARRHRPALQVHARRRAVERRTRCQRRVRHAPVDRPRAGADRAGHRRLLALAGLRRADLPRDRPGEHAGLGHDQHPVQSVHLVRADPDVEGSRRDVDLRAQRSARLRRRPGLPLLPQPAVRIGG